MNVISTGFQKLQVANENDFEPQFGLALSVLTHTIAIDKARCTRIRMVLNRITTERHWCSLALRLHTDLIGTRLPWQRQRQYVDESCAKSNIKYF